MAALPADLTPYALAADLAAAEGLIAANASGLTAVNTSLARASPPRPASPPWTPSRSTSTARARRPPWTLSCNEQ